MKCALVCSGEDQRPRTLYRLGFSNLLNGFGRQNRTDAMFRLERSGKASRNTNAVRLGHHDIRDSSRVLAAHAGDDEIDTRLADLGLADGNFANFHDAQITKFSAGSEFGFDGEGDEDAH